MRKPDRSAASILLVDDDRHVLATLTSILDADGYTTATAATAAQACERVCGRHFDLALVDIGLPDASGTEVAAVIRRDSPGTQVVLMTGEPTVETAARAVRAGAFDYLTKPLDHASLLRTVGLAVAAKRLLDDRRLLEEERLLQQEKLEQLVAERTRDLEIAHAEMEAARGRFHDLLDALDERVVLCDLEARVLWANRSACEAAQRPRDDVFGRPCVELWPGLGSDPEERPALRVIRSGETSERETLTPSGEVWSVRSHPIRDASGRLTGAVEVALERTLQRSLELQASQDQKLLAVGRLASGIAHEINTPIQFVGDNLTFLRDSFAPLLELIEKVRRLVGEARRRSITVEEWSELERSIEDTDVDFLMTEIPRAAEQSLEGVNRVAELVRAMKEFSHPGTGDLAPVDINEAILSTVAISRNEWKYVAELTTDLDPELPQVPCIRSEFNQVVLNLIVNARDAIAEKIGATDGAKGTIRVSTTRVGDGVTVEISDTGTGIPDHVRPSIFDPFFTTKPTGQGSGQGLAIARNLIVEKLGGQVFVETKQGEGSRFVVQLPSSTPTSATTEDGEADARPGPSDAGADDASASRTPDPLG